MTSSALIRPVEMLTAASLSDLTAPILKMRWLSAGLVSMSIEIAEGSSSCCLDQAVDGVLRSVITSRVCYRLQHGLGTSVLNRGPETRPGRF